MSDNDFTSDAHDFLEEAEMARAQSLFEEKLDLETGDDVVIWIKKEDLELTRDGLCTPRQIKKLEALATFKDNGQIDFTKPHPSTMGKGIQNLDRWTRCHQGENPYE